MTAYGLIAEVGQLRARLDLTNLLPMTGLVP